MSVLEFINISNNFLYIGCCYVKKPFIYVYNFSFSTNFGNTFKTHNL